MKVLTKVSEAKSSLFKHRVDEKSVGLVPTMGALHAGHLSLARQSIQESNLTIVTIFVNPIQFNNAEDLENYPEQIQDDLQILENLGVDYVFMPSRDEMYPKKPLINLSFGHLDEVMEGKYRPGHFNGVAIVVAKLLNILTPTRAYFGQKDLQQFKIIEQLVSDLSIDVELVMMPIIREENGLAMSSRNSRLSKEGRIKAAHIYQSLMNAANAIRAGEDSLKILAEARRLIDQDGKISTEYLELANLEDLQLSGTDTEINRLVLCFAGYLEGVRLIDNVIVEE
jgi:pantoate--beta-alanine ligase